MNHIPQVHELAALPSSPPHVTQSEFRQALAQFATGVTVVTACGPDGAVVGLTANSFNSVSLEPPLVLWSLALRSASMQVLRSCSHYAINVLGAEHEALARQFASKDVDRFAGVAWHSGLAGAPLIAGAIARFECRNRSRYAEGDHVIFVGEVERCGHRVGASPLLFHGGKFYAEHPL